MNVNNIIITLSESLFLWFVKMLSFTDIKTSDDIIIAKKEMTTSTWDTEFLVIIHWKSPIKTVDFVKNSYIYIEKILLCNSAHVLSNDEFLDWDIMIPNTFTHKECPPLFIENTIWEDYNFTTFGLVLNWICSNSHNTIGTNSFEADISSEWIYPYLEHLKKEWLFDSTKVILQIWDSEFKNLVAVAEMSI
jgi:hypothetical protein